jgi:hypothetical protein
MTFDSGQRIRRLPHFSVQANPLRRLGRLWERREDLAGRKPPQVPKGKAMILVTGATGMNGLMTIPVATQQENVHAKP